MLSRAHPRTPGRSRAWLRLAVGMVLCALVLRTAVPISVPVGPEADLIAVFGEHILCRSGASDTDRDEFPPQAPSPARSQHDSHAWCCHWHAAAAIIPPGAAAAIRIVLPAPADSLDIAAIGPPARPGGPAQPRAPPPRS